jgi:hypothetical protein
MRDRGLSKIGKAKQCLVRGFAHLSDSLQASRKQHVLYPRWEANFTGWCLIRKLWRWLKLAHFFTFRPADSFRPGLARRKGLTQKKSVPCWRDRGVEGFDFENLGAEPYGNLTACASITRFCLRFLTFTQNFDRPPLC